MLNRLHDRPKDSNNSVMSASSKLARVAPWRSDQAKASIFFGFEGRMRHIDAVAPNLGDVGKVDHQGLLNSAVPERYS
jgi:hypothetical protein